MDRSGLPTPRQGVATVAGARLAYRLAGAEDAPLLVFENGWGASCEQWSWIERELAPHARLLFYNRAGIGGSERLAPQTVQGLSAQLSGLLAALGIEAPVIAVGHSYGGLICSLHAAQQRHLLRAVIEVDSTPEVPDLDRESALHLLPLLVGIVRWLARLRLPNLLFGAAGKSLPAEAGRALMARSLSNPESLDAGLAEMALLPQIRAAIGDGRPRDLPRLFIAAGCMPADSGLIERLLSNPKRSRALFERKTALQRVHAARDANCELISLHHSHGGLVFDAEGARDCAAAILDFIRRQP